MVTINKFAAKLHEHWQKGNTTIAVKAIVSDKDLWGTDLSLLDNFEVELVKEIIGIIGEKIERDFSLRSKRRARLFRLSFKVGKDLKKTLNFCIVMLNLFQHLKTETIIGRCRNEFGMTSAVVFMFH